MPPRSRYNFVMGQTYPKNRMNACLQGRCLQRDRVTRSLVTMLVTAECCAIKLVAKVAVAKLVAKESRLRRMVTHSLVTRSVTPVSRGGGFP
jgi:hypothetical protein